MKDRPTNLNGLVHGCCATKLILYAGEEVEFAAFAAAWRAEYPPESALEESVLAKVIEKAWQEQRCDVRFLEMDIVQGVKSPHDWTEEEHHKLGLFTRYKTTAERAFQRKYSQLRTLRQDRIDRLARAAAQEKLRQDHLAQEKVAQKAAEVAEKAAAAQPKPIAEPDLLFEQRLIVTTENGAMTTQIYPTSEQVMRVVSIGPRYKTVVRAFEFHGEVPAQYAWAVPNPPPDPFPSVLYIDIPVQQWLNHIVHEELHGNGHWLPIELESEPEPQDLAA
jgi:hypothetical protein